MYPELCPQQNESSPHPHTLVFNILYNIRFPSKLMSVFPAVSSLWVLKSKFCMHFSSSLWVLCVLSTSFSLMWSPQYYFKKHTNFRDDHTIFPSHPFSSLWSLYSFQPSIPKHSDSMFSPEWQFHMHLKQRDIRITSDIQHNKDITTHWPVITQETMLSC